jgi:hypothetical protein
MGRQTSPTILLTLFRLTPHPIAPSRPPDPLRCIGSLPRDLYIALCIGGQPQSAGSVRAATLGHGPWWLLLRLVMRPLGVVEATRDLRTLWAALLSSGALPLRSTTTKRFNRFHHPRFAPVHYAGPSPEGATRLRSRRREGLGVKAWWPLGLSTTSTRRTKPLCNSGASARAPLLDGITAGKLILELVRHGLQQLIKPVGGRCGARRRPQ